MNALRVNTSVVPMPPAITHLVHTSASVWMTTEAWATTANVSMQTK